MSDTPTKKPVTGTKTKTPMQLDTPQVISGEVKSTSPGINVLPWPAEPKVSIAKDNAKAEAKFGKRGAAKPWKSRGIAAKSKGTSDVKPKKVSQRTGDSSKGISLVTGYKKLG